MAKLTSDRMNEAIAEIADLPRTGTDAWLEAVKNNAMRFMDQIVNLRDLGSKSKTVDRDITCGASFTRGMTLTPVGVAASLAGPSQNHIPRHPGPPHECFRDFPPKNRRDFL